MPIIEESPCLVEEAEKTFLRNCQAYSGKTCVDVRENEKAACNGFSVLVVLWEEIGGRYLRIHDHACTERTTVNVGDGAGGSFLDHDDLTHALLLAIHRQESVGQIFNPATLYLEWKELARMILELSDSSSSLEVMPVREWKRAQVELFLGTYQSPKPNGYLIIVPCFLLQKRAEAEQGRRTVSGRDRK